MRQSVNLSSETKRMRKALAGRPRLRLGASPQLRRGRTRRGDRFALHATSRLRSASARFAHFFCCQPLRSPRRQPCARHDDVLPDLSWPEAILRQADVQPGGFGHSTDRRAHFHGKAHLSHTISKLARPSGATWHLDRLPRVWAWVATRDSDHRRPALGLSRR